MKIKDLMNEILIEEKIKRLTKGSFKNPVGPFDQVGRIKKLWNKLNASPVKAFHLDLEKGSAYVYLVERKVTVPFTVKDGRKVRDCLTLDEIESALKWCD